MFEYLTLNQVFIKRAFANRVVRFNQASNTFYTDFGYTLLRLLRVTLTSGKVSYGHT
jgi:hypothetical protein